MDRKRTNGINKTIGNFERKLIKKKHLDIPEDAVVTGEVISVKETKQRYFILLTMITHTNQILIKWENIV